MYRQHTKNCIFNLPVCLHQNKIISYRFTMTESGPRVVAISPIHFRVEVVLLVSLGTCLALVC